MRLPWLVLALGGGIFCVDRLVPFEACAVVVLVLLSLRVWKPSSRMPWWTMALMFWIGFVRAQFAFSAPGPSDLAFYNDLPALVTLEGQIVDVPDVRSDRLRLTIEVDGFALEEENSLRPIEGKVLVGLDRYPDDYAYGMRVRFKGELLTPAVFEDFSYRDYLRRYGIGSVLYDPSVFEVIEPRAPPGFWSTLYRVKLVLEERLNRLFPEPLASFSAGILLGSRRAIPEAIMDQFNRTGLTHLLAISGYNITLLITFVSGIFSSFSKRAQIVLSTVVVVLFVLLVGASAAVVRAAFMGILALWAVWFRRPSEVEHLFFFSAGVMILVNPFLLLDDVGFQLSFAATAGLIYATPWVEAVFQRVRIDRLVPKVFSVRETLLATLAAQVFSTPLLVVYFARFSVVAPLANVLVAPFIPLGMFFSFLAVMASFFAWPLGLAVAVVGSLFLEWVLAVAAFLARLPFASIELTEDPLALATLLFPIS